MTGFDDEMQKALEADGEKLRQLTGDDHGPFNGLPRHAVEWQFQRGEDETLAVVVHYDIEPYVPAKISGPPEDCYPAEGGYVTDMVAVKDGATVELTADETKEVSDWIEQNHDHDEDRRGDPDDAYDAWRDDEMMGLHDRSGWDE